MKIIFPKNLDLNKIFNPKELVLTEESMVKVLSDIAEGNPNIALSILNGAMTLFVSIYDDIDTNNQENKIYVSVENQRYEELYKKIYNAEIVEREFVRTSYGYENFVCIDTVQIK